MHLGGLGFDSRLVHMKTEVLFKLGIKREPGWLYYIDKNGDAVRTKMARE